MYDLQIRITDIVQVSQDNVVVYMVDGGPYLQGGWGVLGDQSFQISLEGIIGADKTSDQGGSELS